MKVGIVRILAVQLAIWGVASVSAGAFGEISAVRVGGAGAFAASFEPGDASSSRGVEDRPGGAEAEAEHPSTRPGVGGTLGATTQPANGAATRPTTRRARVVGTTEAPRFQALPEIPKPFGGTTRPIAGPTANMPPPGSLDELRSLERQVESATDKVIPAVVALQISQGSGSGVIISPDGWILTAGHVSGDANTPVTVRLHDGRRVKAVTLGANNGVDSGLVRIIEPGPWPYAEIGTSATLRPGQWVMAIGHPGGYKLGRTPVVRLGRFTGFMRDSNGDVNTLSSDNPIIYGDSGGPLFDLEGRVVGIHSRIGASITANLHVPVDVFVRDWGRIASGDVYGNLRSDIMRAARAPYLGVEPENTDAGVTLRAITPDSPAEKAGLKQGDVILQIDGEAIKSTTELILQIARRKEGETVEILVRRENGTEETTRATLARPRNAPTPQVPPVPRRR